MSGRRIRTLILQGRRALLILRHGSPRASHKQKANNQGLIFIVLSSYTESRMRNTPGAFGRKLKAAGPTL